MKQGEIDCMAARKLIPGFLERKMKGNKVIRFTEHISECSECKEELTIQYLATEGISHLENGTSFNLEKELTQFIEDSVNARKSRVQKRIFFAAYEAAAILIILGIYIYAYGIFG
ncbi:MAG: zf-HC2 domain-containing protein [Lachnospiraceae bacterium]|nr:zf-HC2 domain-containing protein [Lachnospiraceae bacterium]